MTEMNSQLASYIRGQLTVAFAVAVMFIIGFSLVGMNYAITLGILAGFLNLIPYLTAHEYMKLTASSFQS
jgi:predicted PurR-regulated permease PerM